jgi:hypothetical protein
MRRLNLWLLLFVLSCSRVFAIPSSDPVPMNGENISFASRTLDPHLDWKAYTLDYFEHVHPQRYASVMHDQTLIDAELGKYQTQLRAEANASNRNLQTLDLDGEIVGVTREVKNSQQFQIQLTSVLTRGLRTFETGAVGAGKYILPYYVLLIANGNLGTSMSLKGTEALEYQVQQQAGDVVPAYLRIDIELVKFHQNTHISAILRRVRWFKDPARSQLLGEAKETRSAEKLLRKRYLAEGVTLDAEPDHSVTIAELQPLEILEQDSASQKCQEKAREKGHRAFDCTTVFLPGSSENERATYRYVGGRRVMFSLYAPKLEKPISEADALLTMSIRYGVRVSDIKQTHKWATSSSEFVLNMKNFTHPSGEPYLVVTALAYQAMLRGDLKYAVKP